ncbi:hypothetical protein D3C87_1594290 [compost metagenome]
MTGITVIDLDRKFRGIGECCARNETQTGVGTRAQRLSGIALMYTDARLHFDADCFRVGYFHGAAAGSDRLNPILLISDRENWDIDSAIAACTFRAVRKLDGHGRKARCINAQTGRPELGQSLAWGIEARTSFGP